MTETMTEKESDLAALDHLERSAVVPVVSGLQAQGDLIVIPLPMIAGSVQVWPGAQWQDVPPAGIELLLSAVGGNPHTLVAEPGTCRWTTRVSDEDSLALGVFEAAAVVYLMHAEHGASGCAPGVYVVRRQRERDGSRMRVVAD
ncbi:hypothetical protein [Actinomadura terrae]|uniref:hypothetical protein n=1 Tax=Actinomadura terrae TaxID=604353 RepID=UPI001FA6ED69|nr:hypothetical protein [Actinomadura terrae]